MAESQEHLIYSAKLTVLAIAVSLLGCMASLSLVPQSCASSGAEQQTRQPAARSPAARPVGTIKTINGDTITLTSDAGTDVNVLVQDSTRIVRVAPGQKDLKGATPIQLVDLQVGDRILVLGKPSDDVQSVVASSIIVMKRADVEAKQQHDHSRW